MRKRFAIGLLAATIVLGLVAAGRHELLRFGLRAGAAAAGYDLDLAALQLGGGRLELRGLRVARGSLPLLRVSRLTVEYSLRDLLPGSRHRFGLVAVDVDGARAVLTRLANGNFDIPLPRGGAPAGPQRIDPVPLNFTFRVRNASLELREPSAYDASAHAVRIDDLNAAGSVDTAALTRYRLTGAFHEGRPEPFVVAGKIDAVAGYAMHHAHAARFPLRALSNYFAQTPVVRVLRGGARNFDALIYALGVEPGVAPAYHVSLRLDVDGGRIALGPLALPIDNVHGRLRVVDGTFFIDGARATLAGIPLHIQGGVYDLTGALTGSAQLRVAVWGNGDLIDLRRAFDFTRTQPIAGAATLGVLVQGPVNDPIIIARARMLHAVYRRLPFEAVYAGVVYHANVVAFAPLRATYGGISLEVRGSLHTGNHLRSQLALHVAGPADRLPYLDEMLGSEPMVIDAAATGNDFLFHVIGAAASARGVDRVAAMLQMDGNGTALVDPFWLHTARGSLDGAYALDRPSDTSAYWLWATNLHMKAPRYAAFPDLALPQMPPIDGGVLDAGIAGGGSGNHILLAGRVRGSGTSISGVRFTQLSAELAGTLQGAPINRLSASGPWGEFAGAGAFSSQRFVAYGKYRGSFEGLQPFFGNAITGHGRLRGSVAIAVEPQRIVVVGSHLAMPGATLRGVPIDRASLTLAVEGNRLRIYSAHAQAAGGDVVAAGTFALSSAAAGSQHGLALVAEGLHASQLHGIGLPLDGGTITATGELRAGSPIPSFRGGVAVNDSSIANFSIAGDSDISLAGDSVTLERMVGRLGPTYAVVDGSIGALTSGSPTYALRAHVPAARIAATLRAFGLPNYLTDGTFNARVLVGGRSAAPSVSGAIGVPAGEVNGLPFIDGSAILAADRSGVSMSDGAVRVGSTAAQFNAVARPARQLISIRAAHADLSDFNNFFDTGDTLDGSGSLRFEAAAGGRRVTSSGNIDVRGFRYRNLPIGDTRAVWSSARNVLRGSLAVGGPEGLLRAGGSIGLSGGKEWLDALERSRYDLSAEVERLDLSLWLPALGMGAVPVTGRASGQATVRGRFPALDVHGNARIAGGTLGPLTLDTASASVHATGGALVVDSAELATPELRATAAGRLGLAADKPIDLRVHASTQRLAQLVYQTARLHVPISGSFETTMQIEGTYKTPSFAAGFDADGVKAYGIPINSLFGEVRLRGRELVLSNAGASFPKGEATLAGSLPLTLAPFGAGTNQPLSFDVDVVGLDPAIFAEVFGHATKLDGLVDAHLGLSGSIRAPVVVGRVTLSRGSYVSDMERTPLTGIAADVAFDHASASLRASARAGSGTLQGAGTIDFPNGLSAHGLTLALKGSAKGAQLDLPAYGTGTLDAQVALVKRPTETALLAGSATLNDAALPFASFIRVATNANTSPIAQLPLTFDVRAAAGKNVRVRGSGYGAGLDIGATGSVRLTGTLASPQLSGEFKSTGGSLTYFDRAFRVSQGSVSFNPADGVLPTIHAVASTNVVNPDPDRARNPYGSAQVTVTVDGQIQNLKIGLQSTPSGYSRDQILALIAPFGGFVNGISYTRQSMLARQQPLGITPLGTLSPIPNVALPQNSSITVGQEAFNIVNAQFTAGLLAPLESSLGQGLGLSSVNLTLGYYGNVGLTATRLLGKTVSAVYAVTFGIPQIQSFGLVMQPSPETSATLNFFYQSGPTNILQLPGSPVGYNAGLLVGRPLVGNTGFSLTLQRYFW